MELMFKGNFPVKLEFEDDSFELTDAQISPEGLFTCVSQKAPSKQPFRMVFVSPEEELLEFVCTIEGVQGDLVTGRFDKQHH